MSSARVNRMMSAVRSMLTFCEDDDDYEKEERNGGFGSTGVK